jgi:hypothetical protein
MSSKKCYEIVFNMFYCINDKRIFYNKIKLF